MLSNSTQKSKRPKQVKLERLLLNAMPKIQRPEGFFSIEPPESSHFPLEQTFLEGIQLVEQYYPSDVNKRVEGSFHPQRIFKSKGKLVVQGRGGILIDTTHVKMEEVSAVSLSTKHLAVAFENGTLGIYTANLQLIKEIKGFSEKKITVLKIVETPPDFEGVILLSATSTQLYVHRIEKSFFSTLSCKYSVQLLKAKDPIVQIVDLPRRLKHYLSDDPTYKHVSLFCIYSGSQIWTLKLDNARLTHQNFCQIVYKKEYRNQTKVSYTSWGERTVLVNPHLVLLYSFGSTIYMSILNNISRYMESQTHVKYEWIESFPLALSTETTLSKNICFCQHIKRSQILLILQDGQINIFHTGTIDLFEKSASGADFEIITYSFDGEFQPRFLGMSSDGEIKTYADCFAYEFPSNEITYLIQQKIGIYVYCNWKQICDLLKGAQNYSSAMNFLIALYKKSNRFDLGVSSNAKFEDQMSEYIHKITIEYLTAKLPKLQTTLTEEQIMQQLGKQYSQAIDILFVPVQLLVNTYEFIFLFHDVKDWIVKEFSQRVFYKLLQPFIVHARVKYIPETQLKQTLDYYVSTEQLDLVERLAIYFDLEEIEKGIVIQCCLDHNLTVSLAFICTQGNQGEFVTPFVKFWGMSEGYRKSGNYQYAQYFAIRALWYVRLCLERNMALKDFSYEKYGYLISILTEHFFTKSMITGLLEIRAEACLDTLSHYFKLDNAGIVNTYCKLKLKQPVPPLSYIRPVSGNERIELMLSAISSFVNQVKQKRATVDQKQQDNQLFQLLLSRIVIHKTVKFTKRRYLELLKYLIFNYGCISKINFGLDQAQQNTNQAGAQILASDYIIKIMTLIINEQTQQRDPLNKDEMAELYHWSRQVELTELQAQINFLNGHYSACIDVFLWGREDSKERVFRFLESVFLTLKHEQKKKQKKLLQKEVKDKISQLIGLALEKKILDKPITLIKLHLPESQEDLIVTLESEPGLQLEYLQGMVTTATPMSERGLIKYVERMCQLRPEELLESLRNNNQFPVEDCLKICQQYKVYDCMQFLYKRMGLIEKSVEIAMKRIDQILINRMNFDDVQMEPYVKVSEIFSQAVEVCKKQCSESVWEALFDAAVALFLKYKNDPEFANQMEVFYGMNAHIIYQMMCSCSVDHSVWLIKTKFSSLDMGGSMRSAFIQTLSNFSYAQNILFSANSLTRETLASYDSTYVHKVMHSFAVTTICHSCGQRLDKADKALGFFCGHNYHKQCVPENATYCIGCLSEEQNQLVMFLSSTNPQQPKIKIDKLFEQSAELRKTNLDNFREDQEAYEIRKEQSKKENITQNRMTKILDFDDNLKREEDAVQEFELELRPRRKPKHKTVKA